MGVLIRTSRARRWAVVLRREESRGGPEDRVRPPQLPVLDSSLPESDTIITRQPPPGPALICACSIHPRIVSRLMLNHWLTFAHAPDRDVDLGFSKQVLDQTDRRAPHFLSRYVLGAAMTLILRGSAPPPTPGPVTAPSNYDDPYEGPPRDASGRRPPPGHTRGVRVTYERPLFLRRCLDSLMGDEAQIDEVVVVDASSTDDGDALARAYPSVHYVHAPHLAGWMTRSRNEALRWVRSDVVAFLDDDVVVSDRWASALRSAFVPDVSAVAGRTRNGLPGEDEYDRPIGRLLADGTLTDGFAARADGPLRVDHGIGANMAFRREVLAALGGFRDDYPGTALREDTDVFLRVRKLGRKAVFAPDAVVEHSPAPHVKGARFDTRYKLFGRRNHVVLLAREGGAGGRLLWRWVGKEIRSALQADGLRYRVLKLGVTVAGIGWGLAVLPKYAGWRGARPERNDLLGRELRRLLSSGAGSSPPVRTGSASATVPALLPPVAARMLARVLSKGRGAVAIMTRRLPKDFRGRDRLLRALDEKIPRACSDGYSADEAWLPNARGSAFQDGGFRVLHGHL